jgi:hypothetical protein
MLLPPERIKKKTPPLHSNSPPSPINSHTNTSSQPARLAFIYIEDRRFGRGETYGPLCEIWGSHGRLSLQDWGIIQARNQHNTCIRLGFCLAYSSTLNMEATCSSRTQRYISHKIELITTTALITSNPTWSLSFAMWHFVLLFFPQNGVSMYRQFVYNFLPDYMVSSQKTVIFIRKFNSFTYFRTAGNIFDVLLTFLYNRSPVL